MRRSSERALRIQVLHRLQLGLSRDRKTTFRIKKIFTSTKESKMRLKFLTRFFNAKALNAEAMEKIEESKRKAMLAMLMKF
jgi:hypothetical protein